MPLKIFRRKKSSYNSGIGVIQPPPQNMRDQAISKQSHYNLTTIKAEGGQIQ